MEKCTGKKYCDCAREAMYRGANRDWVDGTEEDCPFRTIPTAKENSAHSFTEGSEVPEEDKPVSEPFLKTPLQLGAMSTDELISYIDKLHSALKGYQVVIDFASNKDLKVS